MRWQGLVWGAPMAAGLLVLSELTRLPAAALGGDPARLAAALAELSRSAVTQLAVPASLFFVAAALAWWTGRAQTVGERRFGLALLFGLGVAQAALAREVLIAYSPFAWSWAANVAFVLLGLAFGGAFAWLGSSSMERHRRATSAAGLTLALSALLTARAHYAVYVGLYPTLHASLVQLAFVALTLGLALASVPLKPPALPRLALALVIPLSVMAVLELPASAAARPYVLAYTELGREAGVAQALKRDAAGLLPRSLPGPRTDPLLAPDPDAAARFAAHSGLPALPDDFSLDDYDVLLVLSDATRYDRTSLAHAGGPTPRLAALAEDALTFERAYSPSNGTFPSVASILAMVPVSFSELDVRPRFWRGRLRRERATVAEAMRAAGRSTFWVGHDHRGCFSQNIEGVDQGFEERVLIDDTLDADRRIAERAIEAIAARRGRRYFGLVFFGSPHDDYRAHDPSAPAETDLERYDQELAFMDAELGRLVDSLREDGALDHTVIVFAGDHGEAFGEHGHHFHLSSLYDEQIHVPLVVRVPSMPPERVSAPTSTAYVFPWLLSRGAPAEREAAQVALTEDVGPWMRALDGAVVSEMIGQRRQEAALILEDHALVYDVLSDLLRVYDAHVDPEELRDLREARPDLLGHFVPLARRYRRIRFSGRRFRFVAPSE